MEASGRASSFAAPEEHELLRGIEKFTRKTVERAKVPREHEAFQDEVKRRAEMPQPTRQAPHHRSRPARHGRPQQPHHQSQKQPAQKLGTWKPRRRH